jgi:Predicted membrane protein (DUF2207)
MDQRIFGQLDLGTLEPLVAAAGVVGALLWLALVAFVYALRTSPRPDAGPQTLELGPEPPALANFLVNDFRVTDEAIPATVLDLAARKVFEIEQRGPEVFYVRARAASPQGLTSYEQRILEHLERRMSKSVVPADALTTGAERESRSWRGAFRAEVVSDAQSRGLSLDPLGSRAFAVLAGGAALPAVCLWAVWGVVVAVMAVVAAAVLLAATTSRQLQRPTSAGLEAASRWLGVRAELATNEVFQTYSPLTVALWSRLLAYGAALGVAHGAAGPLLLGVESDTRAWSSFGGHWREVGVSYPRIWPLGWGAEPGAALLIGAVVTMVAGFTLYRSTPSLLDAGLSGAIWLAVLGVAVVGGGAVVVSGASDLYAPYEVTGPVLRLRDFEYKGKHRYFVAVDDGTSSAIRAYRVREHHFEGLRQGDFVTLRATPRLGCVRWIVRESDGV